MKNIQEQLKKAGVTFDKGLTDNELSQIKTTFKIQFPDDLKQFLQMGLPISEGFINWRKGLESKEAEIEIQSRIDAPLEGILFEIEKNDFWDESWGKMPATFKEKEIIATEKYLTFPRLIPIYGHRYIPMDPIEAGNPVFSVYQLDVIYFGFNLATYFSNEFNFSISDDYKINEPKEIPFWSQWTE